MSLARFGADGSDVYIFLSITDSLYECCACRLNEPDRPWREGDPLFPASEYGLTAAAMLEHVARHRAAGHHVPASVDDGLRAGAA